eukprot:jgi/Ulvmu1/10885/UM007_0061.1
MRSFVVPRTARGGPWPFRSARFFTAATVAALTCTVYTCRQSVAHAEQPARVPSPGSTPDQFKVLSITGDGNCMFRALSQGRSFNQEGRLLSPEEEGLAAAGLRKDVVAEMQRQKDFLSLFVTTDWDTYVQNMSRSGTWGGEPELSAAPGVLRAPVHVYQASLPGRPPKLVTEYGSDEHAKAAPVLVLFYGQHYDALLDEASRASPRSEL